jgi:hydroxymethylbilane synthase
MSTLTNRPIIIATRGSALALAQTHLILAQCRAAFPELSFDHKVIKTTGDKLQTASMSKTDPSLPKGLFTKELEVALLNGQADLAVHSLKDLPTELPEGLMLAATPQRADVRDVLIYRAAGRSGLRGFQSNATLKDFPNGATIATSSTRRAAQLKLVRPNLNIVEIRGNVATRMSKVAERAELDATVLALAGITRLHFTIATDGKVSGEGVPDGLLATVIDVETMLPCVGQGAIGIEIRANDERIATICARLNHADTFRAVTAERAFLRGMGGGCQSPVAAYAEIHGSKITMRAVSFRDGPAERASGEVGVNEAEKLGTQIATELSGAK